MAYVTAGALSVALKDLKGTANHLLKIWLTLKQMGMKDGTPVQVTTSSPDDALKRLFGYRHPEGQYYVPLAHTVRFLTMKGDASRSIIQTTLRRWESSGSVVTVDPTSYLDISEAAEGLLLVKPGRVYPQGLGHGLNGFAMNDDSRAAIPLASFCVWYYRQDEFPTGGDLAGSLKSALVEDLNLSMAELELIFTDDSLWIPELQEKPLSDAKLLELVQESINEGSSPKEIIVTESFEEHSRKVMSMVTITEGPSWLVQDPNAKLSELVDRGSRSILLYGPPRTGKTRSIDLILPRDSQDRVTIQIHDGWGYDELIMGLRPQPDGKWEYSTGPLLRAIRDEISFIVLEEINRTDFSTAIGEILSLIEEPYRGKEFGIKLKDGSEFYIPRDTYIICSMNTLDRSTEEVDDALFGRMDAIEFKPRVEALQELLSSQGIVEELNEKIRELFSTILQYYPLGHGYFVGLEVESNIVSFYMSRIRPVLQKHLEGYRDHELLAIDEKVDQLFA